MVMTLLFALVRSANRRNLLSSSYIPHQSHLESVPFIYTIIDVFADRAPPNCICYSHCLQNPHLKNVQEQQIVHIKYSQNEPCFRPKPLRMSRQRALTRFCLARRELQQL